jgi:ornithine carbamoyltransferase
MSTPKHFLDLYDLDKADLRSIIDRSAAMKAGRKGQPAGKVEKGKPLEGKLLAMIFEKSSTRTRVSFDVAMRQLGGETLILNSDDMQLGRGETVADTAQVLSRYVDGIMIRTTGHGVLREMVEHATVPVINGLTDDSHPCQLMADVLTFEEHRGSIKGKVVAWSGDGNNMARTWIHAAAQFDFELRLACPDSLSPPTSILKWAREAGAKVSLTDNAATAVRGADCVVTDTWVSMGDDAGDRHNVLAPYRVDEELMAKAKPDAVFMHCLPAHRGEEVTAEVIDGPQSVVFDEAENRLHAQKGILEWCLA